MNRARVTTFWLIAGLLMLVVAGIIGDNIYYPHPADISFRVLSNYLVAVVLLVAALTIWNTEKIKP